MNKISTSETINLSEKLYPQSDEHISIESNLVGGPWALLRIVRNPYYLSKKAVISNPEPGINQCDVDSITEPTKPSESKSIASAIEIIIGLTLTTAAFGVYCSLSSEKQLNNKKLPEPTYHSNPFIAIPNLNPNKAP